MDILKTNEDLLTELECPVCYAYIAPPIRQCRNIHPICQPCFSKVDKCPVCRQAKIPTRNLILEKLYMKSDIPCQYSYEGCDYAAKGNVMKTHEAACLYRPVPCPMAVLLGCLWTGPKSKIEEHCKKIHAGYVVFGMEAYLVTTNFKNFNTYARYITIWYAFEKKFRIYWDVNMNTGEVRFSVTFNRCPEDDNRFSYRIRFIKWDSSRITRSLLGRCRYVSDERYLMRPDSTVSTSFAQIKDFTNSEGNLRLFVRIKDDSVSPAGGLRKPVISSKRK